MNILKKTMTTLCLSLIFLVSLNGNYAIAKVKEIAKIETADKEEYEVANYSVENIIFKDGGRLVCYKHKKTGLTAVVSFPSDEFPASHDMENHLFIRNFAEDDFGAAHFLEHLLFIPFGETLEKKGDQYYARNLGTGSRLGGKTPRFDGGVGFYVGVLQWKDEIIDALIKELKAPTFLNDGGKLFKGEKNRIIIELHESGSSFHRGIDSTARKSVIDRFYNGKFQNSGLEKEVEKTTLSYINSQFKKIVAPANMILTISSKRNPNYKEVLKRFDEKYLSCYEGPNRSNLPKNFKKLSEKSPFREIDVPQIEKKTNIDYSKPKVSHYKKRGRVFWNFEGLTEAEKDVFRLKSHIYGRVLKSEIEKMGYSEVEVNGGTEALGVVEFDPLFSNNLFYIDLYGDNPALFKKETLIENVKKLNAKFYEKIKVIDKKEKLRSFLDLDSEWTSYDSRYGGYKNLYLVSAIWDSFSFTGNPFSEKFFELENGKIKDEYGYDHFLENVEKHKDKFKLLFEKNPDYVDIFTANSKVKKNDGNIERSVGVNVGDRFYESYKNPIEIKDYQNDKLMKSGTTGDLNRLIKAYMAERFLENYVVMPKLTGDGLIYSIQFFPFLEIPKKNLSTIEKYIFEDFGKKFEKGEIKPDIKQFNELKSAILNDQKLLISDFEEDKKNIKNILNDKKKLKSLAEVRQKGEDSDFLWYEHSIERLEKMLKDVKNDKEATKKIKNSIKSFKEARKKALEHKGNLDYYYKLVEKEYKDRLVDLEKGRRLKQHLSNKETLKLVKDLKYDDFLDYLKNNVKIKKGPKLEKYDFSKEKATLQIKSQRK